MSEEVGTVVSTLDGPSPNTVDFVVNSGKVHRGQFVEIPYTEGTMVGIISDVVKTNRYFERAESVKEFESNGKALFEQFPVHEWEYLMAKVKPYGVLASNGLIKRASLPPSPGTKVKTARPEVLEDFLGFDKDKGIELGELEFHDLKAKLNLTRVLQKHLAILAMSGFGKSHLASVLIEELLDRKKEQGRIATVLIDSHGEYSSFAEPNVKEGKDYSGKTKLIRGREIKIGVSKLSVHDFSALLPGLSAPQKRDLNKALVKLKAEMKQGLGPFGMQALINEIQSSEEGKRTAQNLTGWLAELEQLRLFAETDSFSLSDIVKPGFLTIIDLSDEINLKRKQTIVSFFARKLFFERKRKALPPLALILEEAHQFVPEGVSFEHALAKGIIETIAREGRKFGCSICLISQRPKRLSTTVLSQCGTHIILRVSNPYDLKHIGESSEAIDSSSEKMISSLRVGEALIVGEAANYPLFFKVRQRKSAKSRHESSLEDAALSFEEKKEKDREETEEFL